MNIDNVLASVPVKDLEHARVWYIKLFGREPDSEPMPEVCEWKFPGGGWLQVYQGPDRAGGGSFTIAVTGIDKIADHVAGLGIDTSKRASNAKVKTLMIADLDGNTIAFAETIDQSMAR